jgi:hypothetical protein
VYVFINWVCFQTFATILINWCLAESSSHVAKSSSHVAVSSGHLPESSSHVVDSNSHEAESSSHVASSSSQFMYLKIKIHHKLAKKPRTLIIKIFDTVEK